MDFVTWQLSAPVRTFLGMITSIFPFSVMEVLLTAAGIFVIFYIVRTVKVTKHSKGARIRVLAKRVLHLAVAVFYVFGVFSWLWNSGYFARSFAERNGIEVRPVSVYELMTLTRHFADRASYLAPQMQRDADGRFIENRREMFDVSTEIFANISEEFPELGGRIFRPKPMAYSFLMSRTGYTGIYFALTGEANINIQAPLPLIPATITHEHAHQLGVFSEDEANFVAIIAATQSGNLVFAYSGYFLGLIYLMNALHDADYYAWRDTWDALHPYLQQDWRANREFWISQRTVNTGIRIIDTILTAVTETVHDAVNTFYDGFLRANNQELGLQSYGACIDLLIAYFSRGD